MTRTALRPEQERLWRAIAHLMTVLPRAIDQDLMARSGLSLTHYLVLSQLSEAPDRQLRMGDLAERAALSPSRITRVVQALEKQGFVSRTVLPADQRASLATLTPAGLGRLRQVWPDHLQGVLELAMDHVRPGEIATMTAVVERINAVVDARD